MVSELKKHVSWNVFGNFGGKVLMPLFQILIARQLHPKHYGTFGVAMALVYFFDIVKDLGFTEAIIVERTESDISSQYTLQLIIAVIMYVLLILSAPFFSIFYKNHEFMTVIPIIGIVFFIKAFIDPVTTLYLKKQKFKILAVRQVLFPVVFGISGYVLAKMGWGVYALVISTLLSYVAVGVAFYIGNAEPMKLIWDIQSKKKLFELGKHILIQRLAGFGVNQADTFIIGKVLNMNDLGLYRTSSYIVNTVPNCVVSQTQQVLFTELSRYKDNMEYLNHRYQHFMRNAAIFLVIYMLLMCFVSPVLVPMVLGQQWRSIIPIIQIFSCGVVVCYMTGLNNDLSRILGFAPIYTKYTSLRSIFTLLFVFIMAFVSLKAAACAWVLSSLIAAVFNERIFYKNQNIIRINKTKIAVFAASFLWFVFIVASIYYKTDTCRLIFGGRIWIN